MVAEEEEERNLDLETEKYPNKDNETWKDDLGKQKRNWYNIKSVNNYIKWISWKL